MSKSAFELFRLAELRARRPDAQPYLEFLRVDSMSAGIYVLAAGSEDSQLPHREDEIYLVLEGRARFQAGTEDRELSGGEVLYVAARVEHRFHHIEQQLTVLVLFAPAESASEG
jgi:mannose-6-phosphate isomerase-like protein (cupin superfamily)